jgi:hypothetical protein
VPSDPPLFRRLLPIICSERSVGSGQVRLGGVSVSAVRFRCSRAWWVRSWTPRDKWPAQRQGAQEEHFRAGRDPPTVVPTSGFAGGWGTVTDEVRRSDGAFL